MATPLSILGASVDDSAPSNPVLQIPFNSIKDAISWTTPPTEETDNLDPWLSAVIQTLANYASNNPTNEVSNVVVSQPTNLTPTTRNNIANRQNVRYNVTIYSTNTINPVLDGDDL